MVPIKMLTVDNASPPHVFAPTAAVDKRKKRESELAYKAETVDSVLLQEIIQHVQWCPT